MTIHTKESEIPIIFDEENWRYQLRYPFAKAPGAGRFNSFFGPETKDWGLRFREAEDDYDDVEHDHGEIVRAEICPHGIFELFDLPERIREFDLCIAADDYHTNPRSAYRIVEVRPNEVVFLDKDGDEDFEGITEGLAGLLLRAMIRLGTLRIVAWIEY